MIRPGFYRVTEVLEPYSKFHLIDPKVLAKAKHRGNEVDAACKSVMDGIEPFELSDEFVPYLDSFKKWAQNKEFIPNPGRMYCNVHKITGECDGIYVKDDRYVLFDIKTPANESRSWPLQGAAYCYLARKEGYPIQEIEFVKVSKEGKEAKVYKYAYEKHWELFLMALSVYDHFNAKKPLNLF